MTRNAGEWDITPRENVLWNVPTLGESFVRITFTRVDGDKLLVQAATGDTFRDVAMIALYCVPEANP